MSSKTRILAFAVAFAMMAGFGFAAQADVTGSFTTSIGVDLPDSVQSPTEQEQLEFDVQNELNVTVVISGLSTTLHSHFGIAGVEDVALTYAATLGALDISGQFVFGRFAGFCAIPGGGPFAPGCPAPFITNVTTPVASDLLFIKKRVETSISLGGVSFQNLAIFEDVNFPNDNVGFETYEEADQEFAFGDVLTLSGQTPSGVSITAETGICASRSPNVIKKHSWPFEVNPTCHPANQQTPSQTAKPELMFDFETMNISGIPVASGVTASANVVCVRTTDCTLTNTFDFSGASPIPFSASFVFTDLFTLAFDSASLTLSTGPGTIVLDFADTGELELVDLDLSTTLNPDTNPANFSIAADFAPGTGLTDATVGLDISRSNVDLGLDAVFDGGPPATFSEVTFDVATTVGAVEVSTSGTFGAFEFQSWNSSFTINF